MEILDRATGERLNQKEQTGVFPEPQNFRGRSPFKEFLRQAKQPIAVAARSGLALAAMMSVAQVLERINTVSADGPQPTAISEMAPRQFLPQLTKNSLAFYPSYPRRWIQETPKQEPIKQVKHSDWVIGEPLEVSEEWLRQNPQNIQAVADFQDGNILRKFVVTNNSTNKVTGLFEENSTLYTSDCDIPTQTCAAYIPRSRLTMQNVRAISPESLDKVKVGGEKIIRRFETALADCSILDKSCQVIPWPYGFSGPVVDLLQIDSEYILGNIGNIEAGGVRQFILRRGAPAGVQRIQAITDAIQGTDLRSAQDPRITAIDTNAKTVQVLSSASRRFDGGIDVATINFETASVIKNENFLPSQLGEVNGITEYSDASGRHLLVSNAGDQFISAVDLDPVSGKPTRVSYRIDNAKWMNSQNIPDLLPDTFMVYRLRVGVDGSGSVHIWTFGSYSASPWPETKGHGVLGHFIKDTDPGLDSSAWFWRDLAPMDVRVWYLPFQNEIKLRNTKGQLGFEFPFRGNIGNKVANYFDGMEFFPINSDFSPKPEAGIIYPNGGLEQQLPKLRIFLPVLEKRFSGAW